MPFASRAAATLPQILATPAAREVIADGLRTETARRLFDAPALEETVRELVSAPRRPGRARAGRMVRALLPRRVLNAAMPMVGARLDCREMALRMFVAARAVDLFEAAAASGGPSGAVTGNAVASATRLSG